VSPISPTHRKPIEGFDYADCEPFQRDQVRHPVSWRAADIADLKGRLIRPEFEFKNEDLFAWIPS